MAFSFLELISSSVLEIFTFLYYANEISDDGSSSSTTTVKTKSRESLEILEPSSLRYVQHPLQR